jgi:hypothetical protein
MKTGIAGSQYMSIARQRNGKHVAVKNVHATEEESPEAVFSVRSMTRHRIFSHFKGLKLDLVTLTTFQVTKLLL